MTKAQQDLKDRALRVIAYGSTKMMKEFLAEMDPDGYYPNATHCDLIIHIARAVCAKPFDYADRDSDDLDIDDSGVWENSVQDDGPA